MKGDVTIGVMIRFLLFVVATIVLVAVYVAVHGTMSEEAKFETCKASVWGNAQRVAIGDAIKGPALFKIDCPKTQVKVTSSMTDRQAKLVIADGMARCFNKMGQGEVIPFDSSWWESHNTYCVICSDVTFDKGFRKKYESVQDITAFLGSTNMTGAGKTYFEYLTSGSKLDYEVDMTPEKAALLHETYPTTEDYVILYTLNKNGEIYKTIGGLTGALGGGAAGAAAGIGIAAILTVVPIPGTRVLAAGIIVSMVAGGTVAGGVTGTVIGAHFETHTAQSEGHYVSTAFIREKDMQNFECEALYQ
ncbi:MAG: hypothetical protein ABIA93_02780 [Candidatus Woesearchaeota archaeon]